MKYMLDTNICVYAMKNKFQCLNEKLKQSVNDGLCISTITFSELVYGVMKSGNPTRNTQSLMKFLSRIKILSFDEPATTEYGKIRVYLERQGTPIGPMDMLIAAHALSESLILVTNNTREFNRVPGLVVENWAQ